MNLFLSCEITKSKNSILSTPKLRVNFIPRGLVFSISTNCFASYSLPSQRKKRSSMNLLYIIILDTYGLLDVIYFDSQLPINRFAFVSPGPPFPFYFASAMLYMCYLFCHQYPGITYLSSY